jgi:hypothetical protein
MFNLLLSDPKPNVTYYVMLECPGTCHYLFVASGANSDDLSSVTQPQDYSTAKYHQFVFKYTLTKHHSLLSAKASSKEGC